MKNYKFCAFTGHREISEDFDEELLDRVVTDLIKCGTEVFYTGMAMGFDLIAAECVLRLKKKFKKLKLVACIPYKGQAVGYTSSEKVRYQRILDCCDESICLSEEYHDGCFFERNRYMVDSCDVVIAYLRKKRGGTYYTVNYADATNKKVIKL